MINFSTFFENGFSSSYMLPWQRLKWYYKLTTYWSGASVAKNRQQNVASPLSQKPIFICGADFFQVLIKSPIFGNKNNFCCFWATWPPKCCRLKWCCWGTLIGGIRSFFVKKLRFLDLLGWKRLPIDDLGGQNVLPILYLKNMATKEVSHFSGLSLLFLFMKWMNMDTLLLISDTIKKWPHILDTTEYFFT